MTKAEWIASRDIWELAEAIKESKNAIRKWTPRRVMLFLCARWRHYAHLINLDLQTQHQCIEWTEELADGTLSTTDRDKLQKSRTNLQRLCDKAETDCDILLYRIFLYLEDDRQDYIHEWDLKLIGGNWDEKESSRELEIFRCMFGYPFRLVDFDVSWRTATVIALAQAMYDQRVFDQMPILADALEEVGCTDKRILHHCRGSEQHARGCFVIDLLLGKEICAEQADLIRWERNFRCACQIPVKHLKYKTLDCVDAFSLLKAHDFYTDALFNEIAPQLPPDVRADYQAVRSEPDTTYWKTKTRLRKLFITMNRLARDHPISSEYLSLD